jgi:hypothetical protein
MLPTRTALAIAGCFLAVSCSSKDVAVLGSPAGSAGSPGGQSGAAGSSGGVTGASGMGGAGGTPAVETIDVTCVAIDRFVTPGKVETAPVDLSAWTIEAITFDGAGVATTHHGIGKADGTCVIPGVPNGDYVLRTRDPVKHPVDGTEGTLLHVATDAPKVDLGRTWAFRKGAVPTQAPTSLSVKVTGGKPVSPGQAPAMDLFSLRGYLGPKKYDPVADAFVWAAGDAAPLVADDVWVAQGFSKITGTEAISGMDRYGSVDPVSAGDAITVALTAPAGLPYSASLDEQAIADEVASLGLSNTLYRAQLTIAASASAEAPTAAAIGLLGHERDSPPFTFGGTYFDPFPPDRPLATWVSHESMVDLPLPDGSAQAFCSLSNEMAGVPADGAPLQMPISFVRNPRVNGAPGLPFVVGATNAPRIEWDAPATGNASVYLVSVSTLDAGSSAKSFLGFTAKPWFRLPPDGIDPAHRYVVTVFAYADPDGADHPLRWHSWRRSSRPVAVLLP